MAFATSNLMRSNCGANDAVSGNWSCTAGDTPGTFVIGSGNVVQYDFDPALTTGPSEKPLVTASVASGQTTLTIYHHQTVTNGKFRVVFE